jgi:hypothetical protein
VLNSFTKLECPVLTVLILLQVLLNFRIAYSLPPLSDIKGLLNTHGKETYMIEGIFINILWKGIISCLWVHAGARLDILWKGNIAFLWVLENNFISMIAGDSDFS